MPFADQSKTRTGLPGSHPWVPTRIGDVLSSAPDCVVLQSALGANPDWPRRGCEPSVAIHDPHACSPKASPTRL